MNPCEDIEFMEKSTHAARLAVWMQVFKGSLGDDLSPYKAARKANQTLTVFDEKFVLNEGEVDLELDLDETGKELAKKHLAEISVKSDAKQRVEKGIWEPESEESLDSQE